MTTAQERQADIRWAVEDLAEEATGAGDFRTEAQRAWFRSPDYRHGGLRPTEGEWAQIREQYRALVLAAWEAIPEYEDYDFGPEKHRRA